ncbi:sensor histidine kinase [Thiohalophilus thiocyanatoxydans]|uniref:histidine kinase n=1 Tax=Thiohalophilus thiocyanatoxydans TaxID=381308 RepID=A0A4R8IRZ3_9GAMM|nr:DUF4118 domain-containing protein [Thiohalophilus thiocyanatoxydans]TDY03706.1 two-component system sensor histidine kinase KdpD [Thiohalophilus thiocyanatoxydans]
MGKMKPLFSTNTDKKKYLFAGMVVVATISLAFLVNRLMPHASLSLLFLTGVLVVSARTGLGPSLLSSIVSFLAYNFFFTPPYYTFEVADDGDVATLLFFLIIAAITGNLAARMHLEIAKRRTSLQRISNLYEFSRRMSSAASESTVLESLADHLAKSLERPVQVFTMATGEDEEPEQRATANNPIPIASDRLKLVWNQGLVNSEAAPELHAIRLATRTGVVGMVVIDGILDDEQLELTKSLCDQATIALDRTQLVEDLEQAKLVTETEQLRSALLSSISHDLRTPLASIIGSTTSLMEYGDSFSTTDRKDLLSTVTTEAQRLDRHIQNLLDMTRLGQGKLKLQREWVDLHDIISSAINRASVFKDKVTINTSVTNDVPVIWVHGVLIEQAVVNLMDNAIRFTPEDGVVTITAIDSGGNLKINVCDEGPGIPEKEREKVFDMFYTIRQGDRGQLQGTGLGLAICRGMIAAHGGTVTAKDGLQGTGTCMQIIIPIEIPEN